MEEVSNDVGPGGPGAADIENFVTKNAITELVYDPFLASSVWWRPVQAHNGTSQMSSGL